MYPYELFRKKGNTRRGTYLALSLSLGFHIVIFLILITASTAPATLKMEDEIIHVFLTSIETQNSSHSWSSQTAGEHMESNERSAAETMKVVIPEEKHEKNKTDVAPVSHPAFENESFRNAATDIRPRHGAEIAYVTPTSSVHKTEGGSVVSDHASGREISMAIPRYRENTPPAYPLVARKRGYEGIVLIAAEIFTNGGVGGLKIKKSSGYGVLDRSAVQAVKTWKFEPGTRLGKPVSMWVEVPVKFVLKDTL